MSGYKYRCRVGGTCTTTFYGNWANLAVSSSTCTPPSTPTGLQANAVNSSEIDLSWNASEGATGYDVYYCDGTFITYTTDISYKHKGRNSGLTYSYKIDAQKSSTCVSSLTACVNATTPNGCSIPDTTITMTKLNGPWTSDLDGSFDAIAVSSSNQRLVLIGNSNGGGVYKSTDAGLTWVSSSAGIKKIPLSNSYPIISKIIILPNNQNIIYLSTIYGLIGDIYKSSDAGDSWEKIDGQNNLFGFPQIQGAIYDFDVDPTDVNTVYVGAAGQGVFKSTDSGTTWENILQASNASGVIEYYTVVKVSRFNNQELYVASFNYYNEDVVPTWLTWDYPTWGIPGAIANPLQNSTDGGITWQNISPNYTPPALITDLAITSNNLIISTLAYQTPVIFFTGNKGILLSTNDGESWYGNQDVCENLSQYPLFSLCTSNNVIAATSGSNGLFISNNYGNTWKVVKGLSNNAYILRCIFNNNYAYILSSNGIYFFDPPITNIKNISNYIYQTFELSQNYPNPFNPSTKINYELSKESYVKIYIYNVLGQVVKVLINKIQTPGSYNINWDAANIASGIYFYSLHSKPLDGSKEFQDVKKMILMK
jgi:photosystem II stability/assembly factor-like uncharacterized protein